MRLHGIMAAYESPPHLRAALERARRAGYTCVDAYAPFPVPGLEGGLPGRGSPIPWIVLAAGLAGAAGAFGLQAYAAFDYPLNVGGRPRFSWPAYIPITFELTVLCAALAGLLAFFVIARFPRLDHPVFSDPRFRRASQDRFFVCIRADDPRYAADHARGVLAAGAESVGEVRT